MGAIKALVAVGIAGAILALAAPLVHASSRPKNYSIWIRIGRCEQPGREWPGRIYWSHPGPTFQGGLGIYAGTWDSFRPRWYPGNAGAALWRQQMRVANRIARAVGFSAWDCWGRV